MSSKGQAHQAGFLLRYTLQSFALVILIAIFLRTFLISSFAMSGAAMLPSIWPGDFLIGLKWNIRELSRGQVVALRCPLVREKLCMKRIVGLPGDRIEFRNGQLVLNGQESQHRPLGVFASEMVAGASWAIWPNPASEATPAPVIVPPKMVYLLNDKRSDLEDSRTWGPVPEELLEAHVKGVWMSLDWFEGDRVRVWPRVRWMRLMRAID